MQPKREMLKPAAHTSNQKGFSLIELLIVVAIILVIAAIAIPNLLRARVSANEASAVASIHAIKTGEVSYFNAYPTVGYAATIANLGGPAPCTPSQVTGCLIDNSLATAIPATPGKSGFVFSAVGVVGGTLNSGYVAGAVPVTFGSSGFRLFCANEDGVIRNSPAPGAMPVTTAACTAFPQVQ